MIWPGSSLFWYAHEATPTLIVTGIRSLRYENSHD